MGEHAKAVHFIYRGLTRFWVALCFGAAYFCMVYYFDTRWRFIPYTLAFTATLSALIFLFTRRFYASAYAGATIVFLLTLLSTIKHKYLGLALHAYDFLFSTGDFKAIGFAAKAYPHLFVMGVTIPVVFAVFLYGLFRFDRPLPVPAFARAALLVILGVATYATHPMHNPREDSYLPQIAGYNASALPLSVMDLPDMIGPSPLEQQTANINGVAPLTDEVSCGPLEDRPDIFMVLGESQVSPVLYPQIQFAQQTVDSFRSGDGHIRDLFVEVVGSGTWMTNFSVLTGLSTSDFGWQAGYVTQLMEGRIKGALPELLARCGYRTVALMPFDFSALNEGFFLQSIGFQEIYDSAATGIEPMTVTDASYFDFAANLLREHRASDDRPIFIHIQTMFSHQPYDTTLLPEVIGPAFSTSLDNPQVVEYARRKAISRQDIDAYWNHLRNTPGPRGSVGIEFGDHHAVATEDLDLQGRSKQELLSDHDSDIFRTYYSVHGFDREVDYTKLYGTSEAGLLTAQVIDAARLPTSPLFTQLVELSAACGGRARTCPEREMVLRSLKARLEGGLILVD